MIEGCPRDYKHAIRDVRSNSQEQMELPKRIAIEKAEQIVKTERKRERELHKEQKKSESRTKWINDMAEKHRKIEYEGDANNQ